MEHVPERHYTADTLIQDLLLGQNKPDADNTAIIAKRLAMLDAIAGRDIRLGELSWHIAPAKTEDDRPVGVAFINHPDPTCDDYILCMTALQHTEGAVVPCNYNEILVFDREEWVAFVLGAQDGEFDVIAPPAGTGPVIEEAGTANHAPAPYVPAPLGATALGSYPPLPC